MRNSSVILCMIPRSRPTSTLNSNSLNQDQTGMEMTFSTTTRSVGTIPEVEVYENETTTSNSRVNGSIPHSASGGSITAKKCGGFGPFQELDLISIDRVGFSTV